MCGDDDLPDALAMSTTVEHTTVERIQPALRRWPAALTLAVLAPLIAELGVGSIPASKAWTLPFFGYVYSAGALLIREVVRRRHLGVGSMLALGLAYGLLEEGLALGSLTSTTLYPVADWAPRLLGFNTAFSLSVLPYHAVFSIIVPIVIVDLIFPRLRAQPYLRTSGLIVWALALLLGIGVIRLSLIWMDPRRVDSAVHLVVVGALAAALVAWGLLRRPAALRDRPIPEPRSLVIIGAVSVAGYFALLMQLPGAEHSAYLPDQLAWLAPVLALALLATGTAICRRWSTTTRWSPAYSAALIAGALPAHSLLGLIVMPLGTLDRVALAAIMAAEIGVGVGTKVELMSKVPLGGVEASRGDEKA
jgi:hypothetical protein